MEVSRAEAASCGKVPTMRLGRYLSVSVAALFLFSLSVLLFFGSFDRTVAFLKGKRVIADSDVVHLGTLRAGSEQLFELRLRNLGVDRVRIVGVQRSCGCVYVRQKLPFVIKPREVVRVPCIVRIDESDETAINETISFFANVQSEPVVISVTGSLFRPLPTEP